ncbi:MAG: helix-turn-helix domain-containing protein [Spirochaetes bacterium]|nr:helix-turn-helix domain-containing protein [Spirochaetota bacterium]
MNIGRLLKKIRTEKGFSLSTVAEAVNLTPSSLSQIENSKISPSISSLSDVLNFYRVPMSEFFKQIEHKDLLIVKSSEIESLKTNNMGVSINLLASKLEKNVLESYSVVFSPGSTLEVKKLPDELNGERFIYILQGSVEITINEKFFMLKEKDSLNYKSYYKCLINNTGSVEAEVFINGLPPVL